MSNFEIRDDLKLILFRPFGELTLETMRQYVNMIRKGGKVTMSYNRFTSLESLTSTDLDVEGASQIASIVKSIRSANPEIKSCIYAKTGNPEVSFFSMEVVANMQPQFDNFLVSKDLQACADYLAVDISVLKAL